MHDIPVVPNFAMDGVWINYLSDFSERFSETISFSSVDGKEHFSEIIGHSTYLCNPCCDSSHSMAMIWKPVLTWEERKNVVYQIQDSAKCHALHASFPIPIFWAMITHSMGMTRRDSAWICMKFSDVAYNTHILNLSRGFFMSLQFSYLIVSKVFQISHLKRPWHHRVRKKVVRYAHHLIMHYWHYSVDFHFSRKYSESKPPEFTRKKSKWN